jgi:hypothetical protein
LTGDLSILQARVPFYLCQPSSEYHGKGTDVFKSNVARDLKISFATIIIGYERDCFIWLIEPFSVALIAAIVYYYQKPLRGMYTSFFAKIQTPKVAPVSAAKPKKK